MVRIVRDGGAHLDLYLDTVHDGVINLAIAPQGAGTFRYQFDLLTGEARSRELQHEILDEAVPGKRIGDPRQQTFWGEPSVYTTTRRKTKWVALWRIEPAELARIKGGG